MTALGHRRTVEGVAALPDGRVVTSSRDGAVRLWGASGQPLQNMTILLGLDERRGRAHAALLP